MLYDLPSKSNNTCNETQMTTTTMIQRKRPRQKQHSSCEASSSCGGSADHSCSPAATPAVTETPKQQSPSSSSLFLASFSSSSRIRRRQHRRKDCRRRLTNSWKITVATLFLLFCDTKNKYSSNIGNSNNSQGQQQYSSSLVDAWGDSGSGNATHTTKKGLQLVGSCSESDFQVLAVYLVCDSPGAYYRGSSTYRDSTTCIYGDKARLQLEFLIKESFTGASSIRLEIESGIYDQWKRVAILDDLCSYAGSNLIRIYTEYETFTSCPAPGMYQLDTYFTVPAFNTDSEMHYTPDVRFRFYNAKGRVLGCATTGTLALSGYARDRAQRGLAALMAAFFALVCTFFSLIYVNYGRERRMLAERQKLKLRPHHPSSSIVAGASIGSGGGGGGSPPSALAPPPPPPPPPPRQPLRDDVVSDNDQRYHYFNGNDEQALNGSSHTSNTSNAGSSISTHPQRKQHQAL